MENIEQKKQVRAEQEIHRFEDALGPFVVAARTTRMAMLFTNAETTGHPIIFANESFLELVGYGVREVLGQDLDFFFARREGFDARECANALFGYKVGMPRTIECRRKYGHSFPASIYASPVRDHEGRIVQHFLSLIDLTAHIEHGHALERIVSLQAELIHAGRVSAMGTMANSLAHEINQPLTAISNRAAGCRLLLAPGQVDVSAIERDLAAIEQSALRAGAIINRLRRMIRHGTPRREPFDLNNALSESVELVRAGSTEDVSIECDAKGVVTIEADRVQIQQVVINLLRNGCEAAAQGPNPLVRLSAKVEGDRAVVSVDNSGPPISPDRSAEMFKWTDSDKSDGMGMGLSISRNIVEAHDGEIWLAARRDGLTRFRFCLPVHGPEAGPPAC